MFKAHLGTVVQNQEGKVIYLFTADRCHRYIKSGMVIEFFNFETGLRTAGPVSILSVDRFLDRVLLSSNVKVNEGDLMIISGKHDGTKPYSG